MTAIRDSTVYTGAKFAGSWRDDGDRTRRWTTGICLLDCMGGMTTTPSLLLRRIKDHDGGLLLSLWLSLLLSLHSVFLPDASPTKGLMTTAATTRARGRDDRALEMKA